MSAQQQYGSNKMISEGLSVMTLEIFKIVLFLFFWSFLGFVCFVLLFVWFFLRWKVCLLHMTFPRISAISFWKYNAFDYRKRDYGIH